MKKKDILTVVLVLLVALGMGVVVRRAGAETGSVNVEANEPRVTKAPAATVPPAKETEPAEQPPEQVRSFDDAVFVGDSVSLKFNYYVTARRQSEPDFLGKAQFLTSGSLGSGNSLWEVSDASVHPTFRGEKMLLEESIPLTGAKTVYIMLGINDIAVYGIDGSVKNLNTLMDNISAAAPDVEFCIQSCTPIYPPCEVGFLTNENLAAYNEALKEDCKERGIHFLDVAAALRDSSGALPKEYCSDPDGMGIHLTDEACEIWAQCLADDLAAWPPNN